MLSTIIGDFKLFRNTVSKNGSTGIKVWAFLFPFQQVIWGAWSTVAVGPTSLGAQYFFHRMLSLVVVFRVNAKRPYDKKMGPIGHANMYLTLLPYSIQWLMNSKPATDATLTDKIHYGFIAYTTVMTSISLLLDSKVAYQMVVGKDPGLYPFAPKDSDEKKTE